MPLEAEKRERLKKGDIRDMVLQVRRLCLAGCHPFAAGDKLQPVPP
jgi:hypothetical protein